VLAAAPTQHCLVQQVSAMPYADTGQSATTTDGDGNLTGLGYNPMDERLSHTEPRVNASQPLVLPLSRPNRHLLVIRNGL
jgi:hypothetical protein